MFEPFHRVYLPKIPWGIVHVPDGKLRPKSPTRWYGYDLAYPPTEQIVEDSTVLPYMIEELIAVSAINFILPESMKEKIVTTSLAGNERLTFVDTRGPSENAKVIIAEVREKDSPLGANEAFEFQKKDQEFQRKAWSYLFNLYDGLKKLLVGIDCVASIDIDIEGLIKSCDTLRSNIPSEKPRFILASLQGMLSSYKKEMIPSLVRVAANQKAHIETLSELVRNSHFRASCQAAHRIGLPGEISRKIRDMRQHLGDVLSNKTFKTLFDFSTRVFEVFTHVPIPSSGVLSLLQKKDFMPPVIRTESAIATALERWKKATDNEDIRFF